MFCRRRVAGRNTLCRTPTTTQQQHTAKQQKQLWLGGSANQTRLARPFAERVKFDQVDALLEPLFSYWKAEGRPGEGFGDFCDRVGFEALRARGKAAGASGAAAPEPVGAAA